MQRVSLGAGRRAGEQGHADKHPSGSSPALAAGCGSVLAHAEECGACLGDGVSGAAGMVSPPRCCLGAAPAQPKGESVAVASGRQVYCCFGERECFSGFVSVPSLMPGASPVLFNAASYISSLPVRGRTCAYQYA